MRGEERAGAERPGEPVDCAVIVVSYNSARHIMDLLDSLPAAAAGLRLRCLVVDNDSTDDTADLVRARTDVEFVDAGGNLGYAGAINLGRRLAGPRASLLVINPDVVLEPGTIAALYGAVAEPGVGVAVPMLLNDDGSLYLTLRREPSVTRAFGDAVLGSYRSDRPGWLTETVRDPAAYQRPRDVGWASGAVMLISDACDRAVGDWDERFFLYSEETDFAARARQSGFVVRYAPSATVRHEEGGSGRSPALAALMSVNRVRYYEKHHGRAAASLFRTAVVAHHLLRCSSSEHRVALRAVCSRRRWAQLPRATPSAEPGEMTLRRS